MRPVCRALLGVLAGLAAGCSSDAPAAGQPTGGTERPGAAQTRSRATGSGAKREQTPAPAVRSSRSETAETVYRPADDRPRHDDAALEAVGIRRYASERLVLYSDLPAEKVERLPALVDAVYPDWVAYFGELPPARDRSEYQLTGYLIGDLDRFRSAGLVPADVTFEHGVHRGRRFWMRDQEHDYYRAHLLLHEATHCFMTTIPGSAAGPVWYMEGMAERFGTHRVDDGGRVTFRIMPASPEETAGFGRITMVREEVAADRFKRLDDVFAIRPAEFNGTIPYAWSWAACALLDSHPRYRDRFRGLGDPRLRSRFGEEFRRRFEADRDELDVEWALFASTLRYGYDVERAAIAFRPGEPLQKGAARTVIVAADGGWQSSGTSVKAGQRYAVTAEGRFTLANEPKPWVSEANGITFDYFDGRPLGRLLASVRAEGPGDHTDAAAGLLRPIDVGSQAEIDSPSDGTLYFRVNDGWDRLGDNEGQLKVVVKEAAEN